MNKQIKGRRSEGGRESSLTSSGGASDAGRRVGQTVGPVITLGLLAARDSPGVIYVRVAPFNARTYPRAGTTIMRRSKTRSSRQVSAKLVPATSS